VVAALSSLVLGWFVLTGADVPTADRVQIWAELSIQLLVVAALVHYALRALTRASLLALSHRERFRDVIASSPEAMIVLDRRGVVRMFNPSAANMSGVLAEDAIGKPFSEIGWLSQPAQARVREAFDALGTPYPVTPVSLELQRGRWLEASVALVRHPEDEADGLLCVRDVSEREAATRTREALDARIAQSKSIEALGRLAGGVAHDFNNMLTVISGSVDLLRRRRQFDVRESSLLDEVSAASSRAAALTSQLLSFGRKQVLQPRVMNPNRAIEHLEPLLRRLIREDIQLNVALESSLGCARLDESRLEQVIVNLATNASDAMPDGGSLTISTHNFRQDGRPGGQPEVPPGEYLQISVIDTGRGMSQETHARAFEPFFTTKPKGAGTGLGLATVQGIVAQSGGYIFIHSSLGKGTQFDIYFPRTSEDSSDPVGASSRPASNGHAAALNVLLVEDQAEVRRAMRYMLEALGHSIQEASDGQDALERFGSNAKAFELLVSDVIMPNLGGIDLANRLSQTHPSLKVLLVSGYTDDAMTDESHLGDNVQFLAKPFGRERLAEKLATLMSAGV
jgi:PAS domain S-box-containing protein